MVAQDIGDKAALNPLVPSIQMSRDLHLSTDWTNLISKLCEVVVQGFFTAMGGEGISSGISALVSAASSVKVESPPSEKAWSLTALCFAWSLDQIKSLPEVNEEILRATMHEAFTEAKVRIDAEAELMPVNFLERPTTLPLYRVLRETVINKKSIFRSGVMESDATLRARLDSAFESAIFEVISKRIEIYQPLITALSTPSMAAEQQLNWMSYRKRLIYEFDVKPIFGQEASKLSLSQMYVPLRCYWSKSDDTNHNTPPRLSERNEISMLDKCLDDWIELPGDADFIRLIGGGPGSGKSTSLRSFARRMADRVDWRTLFIPLQHIDLDAELKESINRHFVDRTNGSFTKPPLARGINEDGPPLLLIFDGLDELARPGEAANDVVNLFSTKLMHLISSIQGDGSATLKVVISGRMPSFQAAARYISPPKHGCLEVFGFAPVDTHYTDADELWKLDQRPEWWKQYAGLSGIEQEVPPAFSSDELEGITHEPLLCYLLVLSGFATANWEKAANNHNLIYRTLVDSVWQRGWGEGSVKRQGPGRTLSKADFNTLMQTIALAAWQGGDTRVASEQGFEAALKAGQAEHAWDSFKRDNGPDVTNLAMNFYLKASEGQQRGFEFTHKSFGDYLAARALLDFAIDLPPVISRKVDHAMTDWLETAGSGKMTSEIFVFLRDEVRLRMSEDDGSLSQPQIVAIKRAFEKLVNTVLVEGFPANSRGGSWRSAEAQQVSAEVTCWAILHSLSRGLANVDHAEKMLDIEFPDKTRSLADLIRRTTGRSPHDECILKCFSFLKAPGSEIFGLPLVGVDFEGADLTSSSFIGCLIVSSNFRGAALDKTMFHRSSLDGSYFEGASMIDVDLTDTRLDRVKFDGARLDGAEVSELTLLYANLDHFEAIADTLRPGRHIRDYAYDDSQRDHMERRKAISSIMNRMRAGPRHSPRW